MNFTAQPDPVYANMQDWMQQWSDLETRLHVLLLSPQRSPDFPAQLDNLHQRITQLLAADADSTLYWLFQLAASSTVAYSASHAMICSALCHLVAPALGLHGGQQHSLAMAALTMNIAMTRLQDDLATQSSAPTASQRESIDTHAARSAQWLRELGIVDADWLSVVEQHHDASSSPSLLTRTLMATDRYAALISPRETRPGKCITDSARHVIVRSGDTIDDVGQALLQTVGICPPGTFVRLNDGRVAVVLRRSGRPGEPWVASVLDANQHPVPEPELINTAEDGRGIEAALVTQSVRARLNHPRLLQLSRMALAHGG
ncbi:MAG TPA: phosphodiesterase [Macromonas sp.]|nr:phosphodiesterase [Macromonas sp.]